jgi:hypothetical protein
VPGIYSEPQEVLALAQEVGAAGGVVMSHMRSENDDTINQSIDELAAQGAYARVHISHLKVVFGRGAERGRQLLAVIDGKRKAGIDLTADAYPYNAGYTGIAILFPEWALPPTDYQSIVATRRAELADYLQKRMTKRGGPEAMLFGSEPYAGRTLAEAARDAGKSYVDLLIELGPEGGEGAHFTIDEATQEGLFGDPSVAVCTDGSPGMRHPRSTGTYAKLFARYVRENGVLTVEQAVHKAAGIPAQIMGFENRGVIKVGAKADLVLFDVAKVHAPSSYLDPFQLAKGFDVVIVNGQLARENGVLHPGRHGYVLRAKQRSQRQPAEGGRDPLVLRSRRQQAELLHDRILVEHAPLFLNQPAYEAEQRHAVDADGFASRRDAPARRRVRAARGPVDRHQIAFGDDVIDLHAHVRQRLALFACGSHVFLERGEVAFGVGDEVGGMRLGVILQLAFIEHVLEEAARDGFVMGLDVLGRGRRTADDGQGEQQLGKTAHTILLALAAGPS